MKRLTTYVFLLLLLAAAACNSTAEGTATAGTETDTTITQPAADETAENAPVMSGENYEVTMLQPDLPSPRKQLTGTVGGANVVINYGSPSVKGRTVWGELVPYGEVWRTGANEATTISFSQDVTVEGQPVKAGTYGLFTIPGEDQWTIILNSTSDQWGSYEYDQSKDVLRVEVSPRAADQASETMDFMVNGNEVVLRWESLSVPFRVQAA